MTKMITVWHHDVDTWLFSSEILRNKIILLYSSYISNCFQMLFTFLTKWNAPIALINPDSVWKIKADIMTENDSLCSSTYKLHYRSFSGLLRSVRALLPSCQLFSQMKHRWDKLEPLCSLWTSAIFFLQPVTKLHWQHWVGFSSSFTLSPIPSVSNLIQSFLCSRLFLVSLCLFLSLWVSSL